MSKCDGCHFSCRDLEDWWCGNPDAIPYQDGFISATIECGSDNNYIHFVERVKRPWENA